MISDELRFWFLVTGMSIWAFFRGSGEMPLWQRVPMTAASTMIGIGFGADFADYWGLSENISTGLLIGFSLIILDVIHAILTKTDFLETFIRVRSGLPPKDDDDDLGQ